MAQLEEATKAGPGKIAFFYQLQRDFGIFKVKECFVNAPGSFWWNLRTFKQPGALISVILHQRVCVAFFTRTACRCGSSEPEERAFIGGTKNPRECVTHTTQWTADAAWALRSPEVGRLSIKHWTQARQERCAVLRRDRLRTRNLKRTICWLRL